MKGNWVRFCVLLAVALAAALGPSIFGGKVLLPLDILSHNPPQSPESAAPIHNSLIGDMLFENYAWKVFQQRALAEGDLPLWNPYTFCGHPLYTSGQSSTFYPLNAIFFVLPAARAYVVFIGLHLLLGGLFTYLLFRRLGVGDFGATVGGFVFAMGGFFACRFVFPMLLGSAIWLPLMLLWLDRATEPRSLREALGRLAWGAPLFALPILSGFFEIAFYALAACGLFALVQCIKLVWQRRSARGGAIYLGQAAVVVLLGVVIAAPQILPFMEMMKRNVRAGEGTYQTAQASALARKELLTTVIPDALGNPSIHEAFNLANRQWHPIDGGNGYQYFGPKNYVEVGFYLGILPLLFVLLGIRAPGRERLFFWMLLIIALGLALVTPLYKVFFHLVPGSDQVRTPFRWTFLVCFAATYLAAIGAQRWFDGLSRAPTRRSRIAAGVVAGGAVLVCVSMLLVLLIPGPAQALARHILAVNAQARSTFRQPDELAGLLWRNGMRLAVFLLGAACFLSLGAWRGWKPRGAAFLSLGAIAFVALDLTQASFSFNTHSDAGLLDRVPPLVEQLKTDHDLFRIGRYGPDKVLHANLPTLYGLQDYGGYDSIILKDYAQFLAGIEPQYLLRYNIVMTLEKRSSLDSPLLALLNIRYLLTSKKLEHPDWQKLPVEGNVSLYRIRPEKELPRAFLVGRVRSVETVPAAIEAIKAGGINLRQEAVIQGSAEAAKRLVESEATGGTAQIIDYRPSSVTVKTSSQRRELLVLCDVHYPGWNAYVDGAASEVFQTNAVFRGVSVPAGEHTVVFRFEPRSLRIGAAASLTCLAALMALGIHGRRAARARGEQVRRHDKRNEQEPTTDPDSQQPRTHV